MPAFTTVRPYPLQGKGRCHRLIVIHRYHAIPVPEQAPDHPAKIDPDEGAAVNVTSVPSLYDAVQVERRSIPAGVLVTVPYPVPDLET